VIKNIFYPLNTS